MTDYDKRIHWIRQVSFALEILAFVTMAVCAVVLTVHFVA